MLKFGEGDINFKNVLDILDHVNNNIPFIPEVWQGHINEGMGFWEALENIENLYCE